MPALVTTVSVPLAGKPAVVATLIVGWGSAALTLAPTTVVGVTNGPLTKPATDMRTFALGRSTMRRGSAAVSPRLVS